MLKSRNHIENHFKSNCQNLSQDEYWYVLVQDKILVHANILSYTGIHRLEGLLLLSTTMLVPLI